MATLSSASSAVIAAKSAPPAASIDPVGPAKAGMPLASRAAPVVTQADAASSSVVADAAISLVMPPVSARTVTVSATPSNSVSLTRVAETASTPAAEDALHFAKPQRPQSAQVASPVVRKTLRVIAAPAAEIAAEEHELTLVVPAAARTVSERSDSVAEPVRIDRPYSAPAVVTERPASRPAPAAAAAPAVERSVDENRELTPRETRQITESVTRDIARSLRLARERKGVSPWKN